jgi:dihydrofolate synthase/folylpolyglutamate synthase
METYEQAIEYLFSRINYERLHGESYSARDFKLDRMRQFLELIGNPQERIPAVHIAGTKGKGSTASVVASILAAAGHRVGLFTSPHLTAFEERMTVNGVRPSPQQLVELVNGVRDSVERLERSAGPMSPTYFEIATALAWRYFEQQNAGIAVLEVGLGGRLDATNVCRPEVCVITSISRDHTALLGSDLASIAREKAGIIKPGVPVVSGVRPAEARRVLEQTCREQGAPLLQLGETVRVAIHQSDGGSADERAAPLPPMRRADVATPWRAWPNVPVALPGEHQADNAALALAATGVLVERGWNVDADAVYRGLASVAWPARIEVLAARPTVVVDAAHNWASIGALLRTLATSFPARRRVLIFAATCDKDVAGLLRRLLPEFDTVILSQYQNNPRAVPAAELHRLVGAISGRPVHVASDPAAAWKLARRLASEDDLICVAGSFFIAAELREIILDQSGPALAPSHCAPDAGSSAQPQ